MSGRTPNDGEERGMSLAGWVRSLHRWMSVLITVAIIAVTVIAVVQHEPPEWVFFVPLLPLAALLFSGWYLFALPYLRRRA